MNNTFSFSRFAKYFTYDLRNAFRNGGLPLLVCVLMPAILLLISNVVSVSFSQFTLTRYADWMRNFGVICGIGAAATVIPIKLYGDITRKGSGTDFLMLPASSLEKAVSMVIILAVVLPVLLIGGLLVTDTVCALFADDSMPWCYSLWKEVYSPHLYLSYVCICGLTLSFGFGAILFRKWKAIAIIGILIALVNIFGAIMVTVITSMFSTVDETTGDLIMNSSNFGDVATQVEATVKTVTYICFALAFAVLDSGIFLRIRKMQK